MTIRKYDYLANFETSTAPTATDPANPSDPVILDYADRKYVQGTEAQADNTALKALDVTDRTDGDLVLVKSTGFIYRYIAASVQAEDGNIVVQPNVGAGRWFIVSDVDPVTKDFSVGGNAVIQGNLEVGSGIGITGLTTIQGNVEITGDVDIDGALTVVNTQTIEVSDANFTLNVGGTEAIADSNDAGFTIAMTDATDARVGFDSTLTSKFMVGNVGSESEIITAAGDQTMTDHKTFTDGLTADPSVTFSEETSIATPSAGYRGLYATSTGFKQIDSDGIVSDLGGGGGGSGSGELNLIENSNASSGWVASGAGVTVATTVTSSEMPLEGLFPTGIKITPVSGTDYVHYQFSVPESLRNTKLGLKWYQEVLSGYVSGDFKVEMYTNTLSDYTGTYVEVPLSTDASGDTDVAGLNGQFVSSFDAAGLEFYELRIVRVSGTTAIVLQNVIVGPGSIKQGAVITPWESYTPTTQGFGAITDIDVTSRRVGESLEVYGEFIPGTVAASEAQIGLPSGLTIGGPAGPIVVGKFDTDGVQSDNNHNVIATAGDSFVNIARHNMQATATNMLAPSNGNTFATNTTRVSFSFSVPIAQWAGSGTLNIGENDVEYSSNSSTNVTSDTASFVYGPDGSPAPSGSAAGIFRKRVRFQSPVQSSDIISLEFKSDGGFWMPLPDSIIGLADLQYQGAQSFGVGFDLESAPAPTDVDVAFGRYVYPSSGTYASAGAQWTSASGYRWRVVKRKAGTAVGFGQVTGSAAGLLPANLNNLDDVAATRMGLKSYSHGTTYNGGNAPTITGPAGLSVTNSHFIPYQMQDGAWRLKINVTIEFTSTSNADISINGVVFDVDTALACTSASAVQGPVARSVGTVDDVLIRLFTSTTFATVSGDVGLSSKPTWAY